MKYRSIYGELMRYLSLIPLLMSLIACTDKAEVATPVTPSKPPVRADEAFVNPGGKWMPHQLAVGSNAENLKNLGATFNLEEFANPTGPYLGAVVSLGGCSGSFVSPNGLVVTNYHCVKGCLQANSSKDENLMEKGYLAKERKDEKACQPSQKVFVTQEVTEVTSKILTGLEAIADPKQRFAEMENRQKALIKECEQTKTRCELKSFFEGAEFYLIRKLELKDIRLVYAPDMTIGKFGGETDNWEWPRQTGDFSFLRAYVDVNGESKPFDAANVPYKNKHHLKLAPSSLKPGDLTLVAGYPGSTSRLKVGAELEEFIDWTLPRNLKVLPEWNSLLKQLAKEDGDLKLKVADLIASLDNTSKSLAGQQGSLSGRGLATKRYETEKELQAWIDADPVRKAKWGDVIPKITAHFAEYTKTRDADVAFSNIAVRRPSLVVVANLIVKMAEERAKPDAEREPAFQERNWQNIVASLTASSKNYARRVDTTTYEYFLRWMLEGTAPERQPKEALKALFGKEDPTVDDIQPAVTKLYETTTLEKLDTQLDLFNNATPDTLKASTDPLIQLAIQFQPLIKAYEDRAKAFEGKQYEGGMASLRPAYVAAIREFYQSKGQQVAPDANSTLRVTFGTVKGFSKGPEAPTFYPFTTPDQILAKVAANPANSDYAITEKFRKALEAKQYGPYANLEGANMPVCFLSDVDTTGGNSGSPTLNGQGELIGLLFDGTMEGQGRDWVWAPGMGGSIHVDARYMLWVMDFVDEAHNLMNEMGVAPVSLNAAPAPAP